MGWAPGARPHNIASGWSGAPPSPTCAGCSVQTGDSLQNRNRHSIPRHSPPTWTRTHTSVTDHLVRFFRVTGVQAPYPTQIGAWATHLQEIVMKEAMPVGATSVPCFPDSATIIHSSRRRSFFRRFHTSMLIAPSWSVKGSTGGVLITLIFLQNNDLDRIESLF